MVDTQSLLNPIEPELRLSLAQVEALEGQYDEAESLLQAALQLGADHQRVEFNVQILNERRDAGR